MAAEVIQNPERVEWLRSGMHENGLDALVSTLAVNILMMTGYWPVVGTSIAIARRDGEITLLIPEDERHLTDKSWANAVATYSPGSLHNLRSPLQSASHALGPVLHRMGLGRARIGYDSGPVSEPSSYASMFLFGSSVVDLLNRSVPQAKLIPANAVFERLDSVKTGIEILRLKTACDIVGEAFDAGRSLLRAGLTEAEVAHTFRAGLSDLNREYVTRADGFTFCMSGPNSAKAYAAYAQTGRRTVQNGDLVLVHCNSNADGYWTDITRTYVIGQPDGRQQRWYEAVMAARAAALTVIAPGVRACDVDRAAREELLARGLGDLFKHSTGHGVGFAAISANALPRIHPKSPDVLHEGMVFNVEPAVYADGYGGLRHCDMVAVTASGAEVLTTFQLRQQELWV